MIVKHKETNIKYWTDFKSGEGRTTATLMEDVPVKPMIDGEPLVPMKSFTIPTETLISEYLGMEGSK
jgi:hypothetical protein